MKKFLTYIFLPCLALVSCQPHFDMVPPSGGSGVVQEFNDNWYVTLNGSGVKNGTDWNNALSFEDFLTRLASPASSFSDSGIHIQEGTYLVTDKDKWMEIKKDVLCIRGGYSSDLMYDDLSKCDPELYPTIFTGDVDGDGVAGEGDGAFVYITDGSIRFDNITFRGFYQSAAMETELGGKGSAVFGINGPYLTTSVECRNCIFEGNVNGASGTGSHEGGPCAFVSQGYFKARNCVFRNNSATSRGGAIRTISKTAVLYLDCCLFTGNSITGSFGSAIQNSDGVICANNCTMVSNTGKGATLNGGGAFFLSNCTVIDDCAPDGTNNAAFRCESKLDRNSTMINCIFSNTTSDGYGILMNASGTIVSRGYNLIKSVSLGSGCTDPTVASDLKKDIVLDGSLAEGCWQWDISQVEEDLKGYAIADEVYDAAVGFNPANYCGISVLGRAYATWVTPNSFAMDARGVVRGDDGFQPGAYDPNLDE